MAEQARILVVDDEPAVQSALSRALTLERYEVAQARDGQRGARTARRRPLRGGDPRHRDAARRRARGLPAPARGRRPHAGADADRARRGRRPRRRARRRRRRLPGQAVRAARAAGARARAAAPRRRGAQPRRASELRSRTCAWTSAAHEAWRGERALALTRTEFLLLEMFMRHPRQVLTRSAIFEHVWGYDFGSSSNSLGVYIGYLRRKTEVGDEPRLLHTVRGVGYVLRASRLDELPPAHRARLRRRRRDRGRARLGARLPADLQPAARPGRQAAAPTRAQTCACSGFHVGRAHRSERHRDSAPELTSRCCKEAEGDKTPGTTSAQDAEREPPTPAPPEKACAAAAAAPRPGARLPAGRRRQRRHPVRLARRQRHAAGRHADTVKLAERGGEPLLPRRERRRHPLRVLAEPFASGRAIAGSRSR